ncbi:hypothetical protein CVT24_010285 [Panaeolus cyanescens]|uniref:Uncharacterized protein n=1 Tax=Panaeolus cyanescens TaxID=181874 RepID=A0A409W8Z0_9AGAR|nr:hypothetical protein CVT24_010285 [Panaeolus cyanescens]
MSLMATSPQRHLVLPAEICSLIIKFTEPHSKTDLRNFCRVSRVFQVEAERFLYIDVLLSGVRAVKSWARAVHRRPQLSSRTKRVTFYLPKQTGLEANDLLCVAKGLKTCSALEDLRIYEELDNHSPDGRPDHYANSVQRWILDGYGFKLKAFTNQYFQNHLLNNFLKLESLVLRGEDDYGVTELDDVPMTKVRSLDGTTSAALAFIRPSTEFERNLEHLQVEFRIFSESNLQIWKHLRLSANLSVLQSFSILHTGNDVWGNSFHTFAMYVYEAMPNIRYLRVVSTKLFPSQGLYANLPWEYLIPPGYQHLEVLVLVPPTVTPTDDEVKQSLRGECVYEPIIIPNRAGIAVVAFALNDDTQMRGEVAIISGNRPAITTELTNTRPFYFRRITLGLNEGLASERRFDHLLQMTTSTSSPNSILWHIRELCVDMEGSLPGELMQHLTPEDAARRIAFLLGIPNIRSLSLRFSSLSGAFDGLSSPEVTAFCKRLIESYLRSPTAVLQSLHAKKIHGLPYDEILACKTLHTLSLDRCPWPVLKVPVPQLTSLKLRKMRADIPLSSLFYMPNLTELVLEATYFEDDLASTTSHNHTSSTRSPLILPYGLKKIIFLDTGTSPNDQFLLLHAFLLRHKHDDTNKPILPLLRTLSLPISPSGYGDLMPYLRFSPVLENVSLRVLVHWHNSNMFSDLALDEHISTGGKLSSVIHLDIRVVIGIENPHYSTFLMSFAAVFSSIPPGSDSNLRHIHLNIEAAFNFSDVERVERSLIDQNMQSAVQPLVQGATHGDVSTAFWTGLSAFTRNCTNLPRLQTLTMSLRYEKRYRRQQRLRAGFERACEFHLEKHVDDDCWEDGSLIKSIGELHRDLMGEEWQADWKRPKRRATKFTARLDSTSTVSRYATIVVTFNAEG